jgi:hypothetical protein
MKYVQNGCPTRAQCAGKRVILRCRIAYNGYIEWLLVATIVVNASGYGVSNRGEASTRKIFLDMNKRNHKAKRLE